jgi:hypothetical protein
MSLTNLNYNSNDQKGKSSDKVDKTDGRIVHTKDKWSRKEEVRFRGSCQALFSFMICAAFRSGRLWRYEFTLNH